ncbi:MAG: EI24 domain-containing protein [Sphingomonadales bacterium]
MKEIVIAFRSWQEAHLFMERHRLLREILWPGITYSLVVVISLYFVAGSSSEAVTWMSEKIGIENWLQQQRSEWLSFLFVMNGMMLRLVLMIFYFSLFKYLLLIVGSPAFTYLSEKTEALLDGKEHPFSWADVKYDALRGIRLAFHNAGRQILYFIGLIFLSLIPLAGWITPLIALVLEAYYFGVSMLDYSFARNRFTLKESLLFSSQHRGLAIGNGIVFFAMHVMIWLAPAYAIIAATLSVRQVQKA